MQGLPLMIFWQCRKTSRSQSPPGTQLFTGSSERGSKITTALCRWTSLGWEVHFCSGSSSSAVCKRKVDPKGALCLCKVWQAQHTSGPPEHTWNTASTRAELKETQRLRCSLNPCFVRLFNKHQPHLRLTLSNLYSSCRTSALTLMTPTLLLLSHLAHWQHWHQVTIYCSPGFSCSHFPSTVFSTLSSVGILTIKSVWFQMTLNNHFSSEEVLNVSAWSC